jgi:Rrf2 family nitric oxide-sensitive transcriptional repressor
MRLSLYTDYALRTLLYLATRAERVTVAEVASFYGISEPHLGKVVHQLGRLGLVRNERGPRGGVRLAVGLETLTVGQVVRAFETSTHLLECVGTADVCVIQPGCRLRGVMAEAEQRMLEYLDTVRLGDLLPSAGSLTEWKDRPPPMAPGPEEE